MGVFQPHRYSRTRDLFDEFARSFNHTDRLYVTPVYAAGEDPIDGVSSQSLVDAIRGHGHNSVHHVEDRSTLPQAIASELREGDVVITMGAGNINKLLGELLPLLEEA